MMYPNLYPFMMMPICNLPDLSLMRPPLVSDLLDSIVNYGKPFDQQTSIKNLPAAAHSFVFSFEYPLSSNVDKDKFETMILKKFFNRRIGYETFTSFQMQLDVKLNEIMPTYNKLFDALDSWNLFEDGENYTRTINNQTSTNNTNNDIVKNSNLPQNEIQDIEDGNYMTNYTHATNTGVGSGSSATTENFEKDASNKIEIYNKFLEDRNHIMTLIYKELDPLFYGISNLN